MRRGDNDRIVNTGVCGGDESAVEMETWIRCVSFCWNIVLNGGVFEWEFGARFRQSFC